MDEEMVPLRQHIEALFEQQNEFVKQEFKDVRSEIRFRTKGHKHPGYVRWAALVPILLSTIGVLAGMIGLG